MIDNTNPSHASPEKKKEYAELIFEVIKLTRKIVAIVCANGPIPTETVYDIFSQRGLTTSTIDRMIILIEASGKVIRDGLVLRPTTKAEEIEHDRKMVATIVELTKEIQARDH